MAARFEHTTMSGRERMSFAKPPFFVISCARSGSTSLATILNKAHNGLCTIEPIPNLNKETREMTEGRLLNPMAVLEKTVLPRVQAGLQK